MAGHQLPLNYANTRRVHKALACSPWQAKAVNYWGDRGVSNLLRLLGYLAQRWTWAGEERGGRYCRVAVAKVNTNFAMALE